MIQKVSKHYRRFVIALELLILLAVSILGYLFLFPTGSTTKTLYFEKTDTPSILKNLQHHGYRITPIDRILISPDALPQSGWYDLPDASRSRWYFFRHLGEHPAKTMKIRIYAGESKREIISRLAQDTKLKSDRLRNAYEKFARFKEGDILALTYRIGRKADADALMAYLFGRSQRLMRAFFTAHHINQLDDETFRTLLIIASIIEKETHDPREMPLVSAVIYNRLSKGMKLQMDGTLNYDTYAHTIVTPRTHQERYDLLQHLPLQRIAALTAGCSLSAGTGSGDVPRPRTLPLLYAQPQRRSHLQPNIPRASCCTQSVP